MLYFAYGSNLDEAQMRARCPGAVRAGRAVLANHALTFGGWSVRWGGAVASVKRAPGDEVEGLLYQLDGDNLGRLDRFEGCPRSYARVARLVTDDQGSRRRVNVYLQPDDDFCAGPPARDYLAVLRRAYRRLGFDLQALARAALDAARPSPDTTRIFVYGTLLSGEHNHRWLQGASFIAPARTPPSFELRSLGGFPGLVARGRTAVEGEVYEVAPSTLEALDRLEGHPSFYRRTKVRLDDGTEAETYLLEPPDVAGCPAISSGSWRTHRQENHR
jgi:gamma-glutamylcyclotransferase